MTRRQEQGVGRQAQPEGRRQEQPGGGKPADGPKPASSRVTPIGPAGDQCYAITAEDRAITEDSPYIVAVDGACLRIQSVCLSDGQATLVVCCKKEDGRCKACKGKAAITVTDKDGKPVVTKRVTIECFA
jgi:hypothetical protein